MLSCTACIRRALENLSSNIESSRSLNLRASRTHLSSRILLLRSHSTLRAIRQGHHRRELLQITRKPKPTDPHGLERPQKSLKRDLQKQKDEVARIHNRGRLLNTSSRSKYEESILTDRLKLATEVRNLLKKDQVVKALELCRASERSIDGSPAIDSVVSWNHVIDWLMMRHDTSQAWRVFNEMKKRGHKPSSQTFTILLRGYMENTKSPNVVQQALTVYNSIFAPNSPVKPSIIHTNAVLAVCAKGHDMDSMWSVVGRLPDRGADAADRWTYTTILTAISADARNRALKLGSKEQQRAPDGRSLNIETIFEQAVEDGRRLWTEITARWRKGHLELDAKLVCAMGRLLMLSYQRRHHQEIFSLVNQTMNLSAADQNVKLAQKETRVQANVGSAQSASTLGEDEYPHEDDSNNRDIGTLSRDVPHLETPSKGLSTSTSSIFATPDNNTLSMLIETAISLKDLDTGKKYWRILTSPTGPYNLKPDADNITAYLRLLRLSRASRESLDVLRAVPFDMWQSTLASKGVFVIAMSTCMRDKVNPNVFDTASRILDIMQDKAQRIAGKSEEDDRFVTRRIAEHMSPKVLTIYMQLAIATTPGVNGWKLNRDGKTGDLNFPRDSRKNNLLRALRRLAPDTINVKQMVKIYVAEYERQLNDGSRTPTVQRMLREQAAAPEPTKELMEYLAVLISAYDKILMVNEQLEDEGLTPLDTETLTDINLQKRKLSAFVNMVNNVPGMSSKYEKIKEWLEPLENEERGSRRTSSETVSSQSASNDSIDSIESSAQRDIKEEIEKEGKKEDTKKLLRGLSIRQKHELQKEMHIRANFPASLERPRSKTRERSFQSRDRDSSQHYRPSMPANVSPPRTTSVIPRYGSRQISLPQMEQSGASEQISRPANEVESRSKSAYADLPKVDGWGGGFEELAKKEGQSSSGVLDLENRS